MSFRLMTYNVRYFSHRSMLRGAHASEASVRAIAGAIARLPERPDVIFLQEVESRSLRALPSLGSRDRPQSQLSAVLSTLNASLANRVAPERYRGYYFPAHAYRVGPANLYTTGLATLVRADRFASEEISLASQDITHRRFRVTARMKQTRICAHVALSGEASIDLFNTHLSLPAFLSTRMLAKDRMGWGENQLAEVEALADFVERRARGPSFIVAGDFNAVPGSPAYRRLLERLPVRDVVATNSGLDPEVLRLGWPTCGFLHLRMRLDHVFAGPGLACRDIEGSDRFGDRESRWSGLSDHVPILARIRFQKFEIESRPSNPG